MVAPDPRGRVSAAGVSYADVAGQLAMITAAQAVAGVTPAAIERLLAHLQRARTMRRAVGEEVG